MALAVFTAARVRDGIPGIFRHISGTLSTIAPRSARQCDYSSTQSLIGPCYLPRDVMLKNVPSYHYCYYYCCCCCCCCRCCSSQQSLQPDVVDVCLHPLANWPSVYIGPTTLSVGLAVSQETSTKCCRSGSGRPKHTRRSTVSKLIGSLNEMTISVCDSYVDDVNVNQD